MVSKTKNSQNNNKDKVIVSFHSLEEIKTYFETKTTVQLDILVQNPSLFFDFSDETCLDLRPLFFVTSTASNVFLSLFKRDFLKGKTPHLLLSNEKHPWWMAEA